MYASRAARNSFAGRTFVTPGLYVLDRWTTEDIQSVKIVQMEFLRRIHGSAQLWKSWNSQCQVTCPNREISAMLVRPCVQNVPGMTGEASPVGYIQGKEVPRSLKDQVEWLHLQPYLVSSLCGASRTLGDCCWPWGISSPRTAAPATLSLPEEKLTMKMNENDFVGIIQKYQHRTTALLVTFQSLALLWPIKKTDWQNVPWQKIGGCQWPIVFPAQRSKYGN